VQKKVPYRLTRRLIQSFATLWIWFSLSSGLFAIITGGIALGVVELAVAGALITLLASRRVLDRIENRPAPFIAVGAMTLLLLANAVAKVTDLFGARVSQRGALVFSELVIVISAVGYLVLFVLYLRQLLTSITRKAPV